MYGGIPPAYHPGRRTSQPSMAVLYGEELGRSRGSPSSFDCESRLCAARHPPALSPQAARRSSSSASSSSPRAASDLEQARPQTSGEEELQLQLALAMSREESQQVEVSTQTRRTHASLGCCWWKKAQKPRRSPTFMQLACLLPVTIATGEGKQA